MFNFESRRGEIITRIHPEYINKPDDAGRPSLGKWLRNIFKTPLRETATAAKPVSVVRRYPVLVSQCQPRSLSQPWTSVWVWSASRAFSAAFCWAAPSERSLCRSSCILSYPGVPPARHIVLNRHLIGKLLSHQDRWKGGACVGHLVQGSPTHRKILLPFPEPDSGTGQCIIAPHDNRVERRCIGRMHKVEKIGGSGSEALNPDSVQGVDSTDDLPIRAAAQARIDKFRNAIWSAQFS